MTIVLLANVARTRIPARDLLVVASGQEEMLSILVRVKLETVWNLAIGQLRNALARLGIPQFDETIIRASDELFAIARKVECAYTL